MRILILGHGGAYRSEASIARAAQSLGHEARVLDLPAWHRRLGRWSLPVVRRIADRFAPTLVLCTRHAMGLGPEALGQLLAGRASAFWYFDAVTPLPEPVVALARLVDRTFTTYGHQMDALGTAGAGEVHFLPQGMDPELDAPADQAPAEYRCDVSFIGSGQYPRRWPLLQRIHGIATLQVRGPFWEAAPADLPVAGGAIRGRDFPRAVRAASLSLGINALETQGREHRGGTSNRLWRVLGAAGCFVGEYVDNAEEFARHGVHAYWYRDPDQAIALIEAALGDPEARARIAAAGRAHALAHHTYAHRLRLLLLGQGYTST